MNLAKLYADGRALEQSLVDEAAARLGLHHAPVPANDNDLDGVTSRRRERELERREAIREAVASKPVPAAPRSSVPATAPSPTWPGLIHSGEMVRRFTPPDYAFDGIIQAGFLYGLTASTGTGKTAILLALAALKARGLPLGDRDVPQGRVVYFAGENPDDVTMRWIGAAHHTGFDTDTIDVHFVPGVFDITKMFDHVSAEVQRVGGAAMVVIDTSAAYFTGDDENGNVAMGRHARNLRALTTLPGSPAVLVACHPPKNAEQSNLLPRGGGAFIAELDGNLTCQKTETGTVKLHWQGKFRGPDFKPLHFDLATVTAPKLVDSKGREIPTVMASLVSEGETRARRETARKDEDLVLMAIQNMKSPSNTAIAEYLGWRTPDGQPHKRRAQSATTKLRLQKLVELLGRDGWTLTARGREAATEARATHARSEAASAIVANLVGKPKRTETERTGGYGEAGNG
ncbi:AAA family ATPase [Devosia sp. WQ 349]|uniref:AAA family ATPase n=1 Tax=Devosia sp. WQ 349K1 TaxID=2800329 RepID=UPI0019032451|nr:AAA family ATPase [Devosia sp. WQ 349K1]MBK1793542.1 AAA family ATPase [Devosia sp. WQ 349K1]